MKDKVEMELDRKRVFDSLFSKLGKIKQHYINLVHGIKIEDLNRALSDEKGNFRRCCGTQLIFFLF